MCKPADEKDLADKIDLLLAEDLNKMGANSRRIIEEKFEWSQIAGRTINAYESIL